VVWFLNGGAVVTAFGCLLAVISGAVTSGLGYALWYRVLPQIPAPVAATVQLSVPVIAIFAGAVILGEPVGTRLLLGTAAVLGGIAMVILCPARPRRRVPEEQGLS
ncbi:DMT family transporter, partial [Rhodobacteraceae bacterium R_SAG3]|nr:DMT family transporter [Rhodobacteraceae bacterium R_SAG3]